MAFGSTPLGDRLSDGDAGVLAQMFAPLAEAVIVRDLDAKLVFANQAALSLLGAEQFSELQQRADELIMADLIIDDEQGQRLSAAELLTQPATNGETVRPILIRIVHRDTGKTTWNLLKVTALRDAAGEMAGTITVLEDRTALKVGEIRTQVLAESGRILASSLDFEQTLRNVADIAVPSLADYCGVDILDDSGRLARVAARLDGPGTEQLQARLRDLEPVVPDSSQRLSQVLRGGESLLLSGTDDADPTSVARDSGHLALLSRARLRSSVIVPLRVPSRTIGLMTLATTEGSGRVLNQDDLELAEQLGRRAAVAVENARLHTKLATVADTLQQSLTPNPLPTIPHMDAAVLYRQAETEMRIDVGGDFYEFFEHHGVWYLIFGDIAGKGVTAATITALMRHGARVACRAEPSPGRILTRLNEALIQLPVKELTTAICACLHRDHILISSAGHPSALLVAANGGIREAPAPGPLLGAFGDARWAEQRFSLSPEELLVLYTDGVTEAPGNGDRYGANRLRRLLSANAGAHPEDVVARLEAELTDFSDQPASDDVAVLALRTKG